MSHHVKHKSHRVGWLRAAVLGANDGIVSTASLIIGVASADTARSGVILAGIAGLVAGAMSMAAGEYVSVSSQADTEAADLEAEKKSIEEDPDYEHRELAQIYVERGLEPDLAQEVALQLMAHDALGAHARDEIGISTDIRARPVQAAIFSAITFVIGASLPLITVWLSPDKGEELIVAGFSLVFLAVLGSLAASAGGASKIKGALRVLFWGALAMAMTAVVGDLFGVVSVHS